MTARIFSPGRAIRRSGMRACLAVVVLVACMAVPAAADSPTRTSGKAVFPFPPPTRPAADYLAGTKEDDPSLLLGDVLGAANCRGDLHVEAGYEIDSPNLHTYEWGSSRADYSCTGSRSITGVSYRTVIVDDGVLPTSQAWRVEAQDAFTDQYVAFVGDEYFDIHGQESLILWLFEATVTLSDGASSTVCGYAWARQGRGPVAFNATDCDMGDSTLRVVAH